MAKDRKIDMVILGLLAHEQLSGYDIKKRIDNEISFFWKGSFGSIYPSLSAMEKDGLVQRAENRPNNSGREKIMYSITPTGKEALISWLQEPKAVNDLKYETLLKLFFGGVASPEISIHTIDIFEREIREKLEILKIYKENLSRVMEEKDHVYYYLTVSFGVETYENYLKWCMEARQILNKTDFKPTDSD